VHRGPGCKATLRLRELGSGGGPVDVQVECDGCGMKRRLGDAFGQKAPDNLPKRCRGRHPHIGTTTTCQEPVRTILLGASNSWFPVSLSALSIPTQEGELEQKVAARWAILEKVPSGEVLRYALDTDPQLAALREYEFQKVLAAIERARDHGDGDAPVDLRLPEWEMLSRPADAPETEDFRLRTVPPPHAFADQIAEVVLVERLREVVALTGFTRVEAPDDLDDVGEPTPAAPISREQPKWVPCTEVRGEGLFLRLDTHMLEEWDQRYKASGRAKRLWDAHLSWRRRRNLPTDHAHGWPGVRYIALHTLTHALMPRARARMRLRCLVNPRTHLLDTSRRARYGGCPALHRSARQRGHARRARQPRRARPPRPAALTSTRTDTTLLRRPAVLRARSDDGRVRPPRRMSRLPIRIRDLVRARQPVPRSRSARRHIHLQRRSSVPRTVNALTDTILRLAQTLPTNHRARLVEALRSCTGPDGPTRQRLAAVAPAPEFGARTAELMRAWLGQSGISGAGLALALDAAGSAVDADRRRQIRPVWTGPDAGQPVRLTASVLAEIIAGAAGRLTVISFAAYKIPRVLEALEAAAERDVRVDVVLETAQDSGGALSFDQLPAFTRLERVQNWHWPADQRPAQGGSLHAKAIVADGEVALITSANLTEHALAHNIELGLLVRDTTTATEIESHLDGLRRAGVLVRVKT